MDIHLGRGNANKIINRVLYHLLGTMNFQLISFDGGSLRNAIPREAKSVIAVHRDTSEVLQREFENIKSQIDAEFKTIETEMSLELNQGKASEGAVSDSDRNMILNTLHAVHNGVFRMSPDIEGLVESSSSLARVIVNDGEYSTQSLQRSSVESSKDDVADTIRSTFELGGCSVVQSGDYPGWKPNPDSEILNVMTKMYRDSFNEDPQVKACHAGLECGILGKHLPGTDMISFGPNIRGAHSPDEKVQISSVQKFWGFFLDVLKETPVK
jgi:dipeptidase D